MPSVFSATVSLGSLVWHRHVGAQLPATPVSGRPSRFAGGAAHGTLPVINLQVSVRRIKSTGLGLHVNRVASFGHKGLAVQAPFFEHFMRLPASLRLKPQSNMSERFCTSPFASVTQHICRSLTSQGRRTPSPVSSSKHE